MCKYCEKGNNDFPKYILSCDGDFGADVCVDDNILKIKGHAGYDSCEDSVEISYCPMCGKKLIAAPQCCKQCQMYADGACEFHQRTQADYESCDDFIGIKNE